MDTPQIMEENGKRYRMLQVGETIEEGDEVLGAGVWYRVDGWVGQPINPTNTEYLPFGYYRRPIQ